MSEKSKKISSAMKIIILFLISVSLTAACSTVRSSVIDTGNNEIDSMDGVIAAPEHHKIIFENERVRVIELKIAPGEIVPLHTHRWPTVNYVLKPSDFLSLDSDGNVKLDSRTQESGNKEGTVFSQPAFPPLHSVKNIGTNTMHGIAVELKD